MIATKLLFRRVTAMARMWVCCATPDTGAKFRCSVWSAYAKNPIVAPSPISTPPEPVTATPRRARITGADSAVSALPELSVIPSIVTLKSTVEPSVASFATCSRS